MTFAIIPSSQPMAMLYFVCCIFYLRRIKKMVNVFQNRIWQKSSGEIEHEVTMPGQLGGAPLCLVCNTRAYFNDQKTYKENVWHKKCFRCGMYNLFIRESLFICSICIHLEISPCFHLLDSVAHAAISKQ